MIHIAQQLNFPKLYDGVEKFDSINDFLIILANLIQIGLILSGVLAVIFISWSGVQYIISQGDPARVQTAKGGIRNAVVGLILAGGAFLIVEFFTRRLLG